MKKVHRHPLEKILENRIVILDGAMGTTIRSYGMTEGDIRGERFKNAQKGLLNNGDLFSLTKPEMIGDIHRRFRKLARILSRQTPSAQPASPRANSLSTIRESTAAGRIPPFTKKSSKIHSLAAWLGISMSNRRGSAVNGPIVSEPQLHVSASWRERLDR